MEAPPRHTSGDQSQLPGRRIWLKSAAAATLASAYALPSFVMAASNQNSGRPEKAIESKMVGLMLAHEQFTVPQVIDIGVSAEQAGFDLLTTSDHFQPWQANEGHSGEAWATLGALSQRTQRVWMGTTVTCPTFRYNPAVVAEAFATLDALAPGRIFLGLVPEKHSMNRRPPVHGQNGPRLVEATDIIREMWTGKQIAHQGKYYNVNARLYDRPEKTIPLLMAANGPKAMRRAGQYADGLVTDPKTWKEHKAEFEMGAKSVGKDASRMPVLVEQYVVVGERKDAEAAAEL
jgi:F420-dependent hydroxymycolic acid dehydrogenase